MKDATTLDTPPSPTFTEFNVRLEKGKPHFIRLHDGVVRDLERQFATKYNDEGKVVETLADVPIENRANVKVLRRPKNPMAGMTWPQRREFLERTDGLRKLP